MWCVDLVDGQLFARFRIDFKNRPIEQQVLPQQRLPNSVSNAEAYHSKPSDLIQSA
jgi:hypothetical protein